MDESKVKKAKLRALKRAIEVAGGPTALAGLLGKHQSLVSQWKHRKQVPAAWVLLIEKHTGVSRYELRPDVFGTPVPGRREADQVRI
jgi:DNA-binding transcriptional regulator YdaS (Cro superfamily)